MNVELLARIAEWLEAGGYDDKHGFNMACGVVRKDDTSAPGHDCHTMCCIAGYAVMMFCNTTASAALRMDWELRAPGNTLSWVVDVLPLARQVLDLDQKTADDLFTPPGYDDWGVWPPERAARMIRHLIDTGEVNWHA